jgi:hypothetical protein
VRFSASDNPLSKLLGGYQSFNDGTRKSSQSLSHTRHTMI